MTTQDIFKNFGSNWKWASMTKAGTARIHSERPWFSAEDVLCYNLSTTERCAAFDQTPSALACIVDRTDFSNGPSYVTDKFGHSLVPQVPQIPTPPPIATGFYTPPLPTAAVTHLTTDEAENGALWEFAKAHEQHVMVNCFGVVWFDVSKGGGQPRRETAVMVDGVAHVIERTRSLPVQVSPQEAGMPYVDEFDAQPVAPRAQVFPSAPETVTVTHRGAITQYGDHTFVWYDEAEQTAGAASTHVEAKRQLNAYYGRVSGDTPDSTYSVEQFARLGAKIQEVENALTKAKAHAKHLLSQYNNDDSRQQLSVVQYLAIFGELPQ